MAIAAHNIVYFGNLGVCAKRACVLNVAVNSPERRMAALVQLFNVLVHNNEGETLSSPSLGTLVCADCAKLVETVHFDCRKRYVWVKLPSLLGWGSWGDVWLRTSNMCHHRAGE